MSRFVRPDTRTLTLANGDTVIVRARLTAGETRAHFARMMSVDGNGFVKRNPMMSGISLIVSYLLDWNFKDDAGQVVQIRDLSADELATVIDSLDMPSFNELRVAIENHETAMDDEKKTTDGATPSLAI